MSLKYPEKNFVVVMIMKEEIRTEIVKAKSEEDALQKAIFIVGKSPDENSRN